MPEKKELSNEELEKVTGGNNGDSKREGAFWSFEVNYLYKVNDIVEVYDNVFHTTTERATITDRRPKYVYGEGYGDKRYIGEYQVHYHDEPAFGHYQDEWVVANDIER